ncbi:hypothetical protein GW796_09135 [archaeon]|nr:hypothetical protein [archaeon]
MGTHKECISYKKGICLHKDAPRLLLGTALCILDYERHDPRIPSICLLQTKKGLL